MILARPFKAGLQTENQVGVASATHEHSVFQASLTRRRFDSVSGPALKGRAKLSHA